MTEKNKKLNIAGELQHADKALGAARILATNSYYNDCVSRLYYVILYHLSALLLTKGLEPKTHEGALTLFSLHFVKPGIFPPADSHLVARLMKYREEADYSSSYVFTKTDCADFTGYAQAFSKKIEQFLRDGGYLP